MTKMPDILAIFALFSFRSTVAPEKSDPWETEAGCWESSNHGPKDGECYDFESGNYGRSYAHVY